jgi:hypothetical protein
MGSSFYLMVALLKLVARFETSFDVLMHHLTVPHSEHQPAGG